MKAFHFTGTGTEYFKIWIVNILLTLITFGLYYPWAKVRTERYFNANTELEGKNFEYHATGKQLFVGYLIAMAIFILYMVAVQVSPLGAIFFPLALFIAIPWIIWRSLKFHMIMTSFSNVRFGFKGTIKGAYINYFLYPFLFILAIYILPIGSGVILPKLSGSGHIPTWAAILIGISALASLVFAIWMYAFMKKKHTEYIINGSRFGQGVFSTDVNTKKFLMIVLKTLGLSILLFALPMILLSSVVALSMTSGGSLLVLLVPVVYLLFIIASMFVIAYSLTRQRSYVYANTRLDSKINFASTLKAKSLSWVMISNLFLILFTFGLAFPWAKVRVARLVVENTLVDTSIGFNEYMTEKQNEESSLGEQIGDAFDVDVGLGF